MRVLVFFFTLTAIVTAQNEYQITPSTIHQGETLHLRAPAAVERAKLLGHEVPLFTDAAGTRRGLMPVGALEPAGETALQFLDAKGQAIQTQTVMIHDAHYPRQNIVIPPAVAALKPSEEEEERIDAFLKTITDTRYWKEPLAAPVNACLTSLFGVARMHNGKLTGDYHKGWDQAAVFGIPIHSVAAGVVRIVKQFPEGGGTVAVDHGQGLQSIYLHMSRFQAHEGEQVAAGAVLGYVGSTG